MKAWKGSANARDLGGDAVHPGPIGQFTMAATILQKLGVEKEVSAATLSAEGKVITASKCVISDVQSQGGVLKFTRLDESKPWPVPALARPALVVMPEIADLSVLQTRGEWPGCGRLPDIDGRLSGGGSECGGSGCGSEPEHGRERTVCDQLQ